MKYHTAFCRVLALTEPRWRTMFPKPVSQPAAITWESTRYLVGRKLLQPALFIGGAEDPWIEQVGRPAVDKLEESVPSLWKKVLLPGVGH
jgi:hypothetical protein